MGRLVVAVGRTVEALEGRVSPVDAALVAAVEELAVALEEKPDSAALWDSFLDALTQLRGLADGDDDFDQLLAEINRDPQVGDSPAA